MNSDRQGDLSAAAQAFVVPRSPRTARIRSWLAIVALPAVVVVAGVCAGGDVTPDSKWSWDTDGDTISDAVEIESHNSQRYLLPGGHPKYPTCGHPKLLHLSVMV